MILNDMCQNCWHQFVCDKRKTLLKFENSEKGFIGVDIEMKSCRDYIAPDAEDVNVQ